MTQADGETPTAQKIRAQMRTVKPLLEAYTAALTAAARLDQHTRTERRYDVLASLSEAHYGLVTALDASGADLGLPYERVIKAEYTAYFPADG